MSPSLFWQLIKDTGNAWLANKASRLGAALAFYSVLSLSPLLILLLAIASLIWSHEAAMGQISDQITNMVGGEGAKAIQSILAAGDANSSKGVVAAIIGFGSLLFSASAVFGELHDSLNLVWHAKAVEGRPIKTLVREKITAVTMVMGTGVMLITSVVISTALAAAGHFIDNIPLAIYIMAGVNLVASFVIISALFTVIFKTVPDMIIPWRAVWPGGMLTALLFMIGKGLIGLYIGNAGVASGYGAAGSLIVLLVWVYYSAQILFFGAEFAYVYSSHFKLHDAQQEAS